MKIKVMLGKYAKMPTKAFKADAGFDLYSNQAFTTINPHESAAFRTGAHILIPKGYCGLLVAKSGLNVRNGVTSTGLVDSGYTAEIIVKLYNNSDSAYTVFKGDKISQIVILPIPEVELEKVETWDGEDNETERGDNGFGSSGR